MYRVRVYPDPRDPVPATEIFEVVDAEKGDLEVVSDAEVREHPEVPLTAEQRDAVLERLGYCRTGAWQVDEERAEADVEPATGG